MISKLKKKADRVFSQYIRLRDAKRTTGGTVYAKCITCGQTREWKKMDAGHWMSRGAGSTRYDEHNVHAQCKGCNAFRGGRHEEYRRALVDLYGEKEVDRIYFESKKARPFKRVELDELIKKYSKKVKELDG